MKVQEINERIEELQNNIETVSAIMVSYENSGQDPKYTVALGDAVKCMQLELTRYTNADWKMQPY